MRATERRRCAIYTRTSSEEGLAQDFNSLHAQREACEAFIRSQQGEGWRLIETGYDDGGFSGGSLDRPALQRLLADIAGGGIDTVVVYKVDRLTRSLTDFAKVIDLLDRHRASFVAVTQQFNTTTSMGRLTLNILLSFAQFEREVTGERIRDKIAASKRKGMWMGGVTPLGYAVKDRKLLPIPAEAETVRAIYAWYLELGSVRLLQQELERRGIRSKVRLHADGSRTGGAAFSRGALYALLSNPLYVGEVAHKGARYPGQHEATVERELWEKVQLRLREQGPGALPRGRKTAPSPLTGKLFDAAGKRLSPSHAVKGGRRYRYYITTALMRASRSETGGWRLPAPQLEAAVAAGVARCLADRGALIAAVEQAGLTPDAIGTVLRAAADHRRRLQSEIERAEAVSSLLARVELMPGAFRIILRLSPLVPPETAPPGAGEITVARELPLQIKRRGVERKLVIDDAAGTAPRTDPILLREVARAYRCFDALLTRKVASFSELAAREQIDGRYLRRILPLAFLAPGIVRAIVEGRQPLDLTAKALVRRTVLPLDWQQQKRVLGFA